MSLGKLSLKDGWLKGFEEQMKKNTIQWLPIERLHCEEVSKLPFHHRDPFDRMLIAQALVEELALIEQRHPACGIRDRLSVAASGEKVK